MAQDRYVEEGPGAPERIWIPSVSLRDMNEESLHLLLWQVRGHTDVLMLDQRRQLSTGYALWIPAGVPHDLTVAENSVMVPTFFEASETATTLRKPTMVSVDRDLQSLILAYYASFHTRLQPPINLGRQILAIVEGRPAPPTALPMPEREPAQTIAETLRFNPGDARSVEELARSIHTSSRSVERSFRVETGMTLRQWRLRNRMEAAAVLLTSEATAEAVAHRVGYTNVNAFRRVFRSHFGMSPSAYVARYALP